ncbi:MAG: rod shape-determining protein MreC [Gammaproteobacteria bacterium]|jgi:rod shape-determining protein MreC|nr:rod shape-determining protein MreC [Gammaproteobacteria bacterium]
MTDLFGRAIRRPSSLTRLVLLVAFSATLMVLDHQGNHLPKIRATLAVLVYPIQFAAALPVRASSWVSELLATEKTLRERNRRLQAERSAHLARLQKLEALEAENARLRDLLGSAERVADRAVVAELVQVSLEPFTRKIVVNKGKRDEVYVGQPVIDAYGIVGQITEVGVLTSKSTLITDPGHAISVVLNRNGLRTVVFGTGAFDRVSVPYLTPSADIQEGDLLVSSGMGGNFPPGYPVAQVTEIIRDANEAFLKISAKPMARLNYGKEVLLIWPGRSGRT